MERHRVPVAAFDFQASRFIRSKVGLLSFFEIRYLSQVAETRSGLRTKVGRNWVRWEKQR